MEDSEKSVDLAEGGEGKLQRSLDSTLRKINLSEEEKKYREENFSNVDLIKDYKEDLVCTRCDLDFGRTIRKGETVMVHPLLGVLMCDDCCDYYGDGNFSMDSEGEDKYCRWCGDGGTIFVCSKCNFGFCDVCIKKHFKESGLEDVRNNDNWTCYFCDPKPLWYLRSVCSLAEEVARNKRDHLKKKDGRRIKKKRRKKGSDESDMFGKSSGDDSTSSSLKHVKPRRSLRNVEKVVADSSSSSDEDDVENHTSLKKRLSRSRKQASNEDKAEHSSDTSTKRTRRKKLRTSREVGDGDPENKKPLLLDKLKSIWKLTESVLEAGLTSSREKVKHLSKNWKFKNLESLRREHEDLKSCIAVLATSINSASNSVNSIKDDLTFDPAKNESEIIRREEMKLKRLAKKFQKQSKEESSADSDGGNTSQNDELEEEEEKKKKKKRATGDAEEKKGKQMGVRSDEGSEGREDERGKNVSEGEGKVGSANEEDNECEKGSPVKPLLKVKSFAKMLNDNVYDKDKNSGTVDVYDVETDDSENGRQTNGGNKKEPSKAKEKDKAVNDAKKNSKNNSSDDEETKKKSESESESEQEKENNTKNKKNVEKGKKKKKVSSESEIEESEESEKEKKKKKKATSEIEIEEFEESEKEKKKKKASSEVDIEESEESEKEKKKKKASSESEIEEFEESEKEKKKKKASSESEIEESEEREKENKKKKKASSEIDIEESEESEKENKKKKKKASSEIDIEESEESEKGKKKKKASSGSEIEESEESEKEKKKKKKGSSEIDIEESKESEKSVNQEEENPSDEKETASGGEEKRDSESGDENEKKKEKEKKNSSHEESQKSSDEEEPTTRRTRNSKKAKNELKASFEKFKRKRERYLRSAKEAKVEEEKVKETKVLESSESGSETEKKEKLKNWRPKKKRVLASSDEENGEKKDEKETKSSDGESSDEAKAAKNSEVESEKENQNGRSDAAISPGSTSEEEFDTRKKKRIRKRKKRSSESGEDAGRKKRRRTKGGSSDSSEDEEDKKGKKGRRNIKKIIEKDSLQVETKEALKNEEERKKRLKEKQKLFEELFPEVEGKKSRRLILDFDPETKEPLVTIHKKLAKRLKPHQFSGVKFMWDSCFESVQKLEEDDGGSGCILAHCMGLGKTLQVVTLVHTVMTHDLGIQSVLIVCPLSTVSNWMREFEMWLENIHTEPITLYDLVKYKRPEERRMHLEDWHKNGGVLVLSYDLFRNLTKSVTKQKKERKRKSKRMQEAFGNALLDPGPDLVVCDEGHLLKNEDTALSKCMSRLRTARRIVLTGTPLQNNLIEYHCMVQFVKPNILGTRKEFCNRFVNPINNGQFEDSTELDVKIMKRRSHVLHSMLEGCIQRFDYSVLTPFLPEKHEYVLQIALTDTQAKVYQHFIQNLSAKSSGNSRAASLFNDYHSLQRIWTHPRTLLMQREKEDRKEALASDSEGSLKDFVVSSEEETSDPGSATSDNSEPEVIQPRKRVLRSNANDPEVKKMIEEEEKEQNRNWWDEFYEEKAYDNLRESNKLVLLFDLLKYCREVKDKVLVFSQSLYSLDLIEYFLAKVDENSKKEDETLCGHQDTWILGSDYFRLDGSTNSETRRVWCKTFNKESNTRGRLFLISTKAGGLGINLYGANRVVIFDASWNPSHDLQSIFRVYRFGQKKPCFIYRFLSEATMEEKIYERQVTKLSLAHRVVDEHQIERHYTMGNLQELYTFEPIPKDKRKVPNLPKDPVLADLLANHKDVIVGYHEHDSLLENKQEEELSEEERKAAWKEYEEEKVQRAFNNDFAMQQMLMFQQAQQQFLMMQQQQQQQQRQQLLPQGEGTYQIINPAHFGIKVNPNHVNPIYLPPNIPVEALRRGLQVGMTPLPKESLESFMKRVISRESWLNAEVID